MPVSASEEYLHALAERTFLKLWSVPNPFRAPGKEILDLVIVFGQDVILFSDKACEFVPAPDLKTGWERWRRGAIDGSVAQLAGAMRRLSGERPNIFLDAKAKESLPFPFPSPGDRKFHLVAIARPSHDPASQPEGWRGLTCVSTDTSTPFEVGPLMVNGLPIHLFDGTAIDLLLQALDTAPDFLAYLTGRASRLGSTTSYRFAEEDLLAGAILNWGAGSGLSPAVPPLDQVEAGAWAQYQSSERAERSATLNRRSRTIDNLIEHFHSTFLDEAFLNAVPPGILEHERALRLLAAESRFARRMIVAPLIEILEEEDQSKPWTSTVPSPTQPGLRYVWMIYPDPPDGTDPALSEKFIDQQLSQRILVYCGEFGSQFLVGITLPNGKGVENVVTMKVLDGSGWTDDDRRNARELQQAGLFGDAVRTDYVHIP